MHATPSIPEVDYPTILTWSPKTIPMADVAYGACLDVFLTALLQTVGEHDAQLLSALNSLPRASQQLITESPDTYTRLNAVLRCERPPSWLMSYLNTSIAVEQLRLGNPNNLAIGKWSSNGGLFCDREDAVTAYSPEGWRTAGHYTAKHIATIPIDHASVFARADMPVAPFRSVRYGEATPFTANEASAAEAKVIAAFAAIEKAAPYAARFISRYVKSVVLRKNNADLDVFQSASRNGYVGQVVLLNPHGDQVDVAYMAESLVHEAIHSLMWRQEILSHFLVDPSKQMGTVTSPWSGETIYYYTMLQACFVWFGIAQFWRLALDTPHFLQARAEALFHRAVRGFKTGKVLPALRTHESNLTSGIMPEFSRMVSSAAAL